jgi:hypothetical protein
LGYTERRFGKHRELRNAIVSLDNRFTVNMYGFCGVNYRDPDTREITPIDILPPKAVSTYFILLAMDISHAMDIYRLSLYPRELSFPTSRIPLQNLTSCWHLPRRSSR